MRNVGHNNIMCRWSIINNYFYRDADPLKSSLYAQDEKNNYFRSVSYILIDLNIPLKRNKQ